MNSPLTAAELHRLRWRSRRGLLENDLLIERFFTRHGAALTRQQAQAFTELMQLGDGELLDILLHRKNPAAGSASMHALLHLLRPTPKKSLPTEEPVHENCRP